MKTSDLSTSKFLKQADIEEPLLVTIKDVRKENVSIPGEALKMRGTMYFEELDKPMVMNKTNLQRAAKAFASEETDDWIGKKIVLYVDENVEFGGEIVGGLRLRAAKSKSQQPKQSLPPIESYEDDAGGIIGMDEDIPFQP